MKCRRASCFGLALVAAVLAAGWAAAPARGQQMKGPPGGHNLQPSIARPDLIKGIGIDQKLGAQVPGDLAFRDENGRDVQLKDYYGKKPIVLALVYYDCPMLCTVVLNELERTLKGMGLGVGESFDVLTVSFDPKETPSLAAAKRAEHLKRLDRPGAENGWHFLTGDAEPIRRLTDAVGFRYAWDDVNKQYVHSSGLMVLTPDGKISRYFYGVDYAPQDVQFALQEASGNKIGSPSQRALLYCFQYDPRTGKYSLVVVRALQVGGVLTLLALGTFMVLSARRGRLKVLPEGGAGGDGDAASGSAAAARPAGDPAAGAERTDDTQGTTGT